MKHTEQQYCRHCHTVHQLILIDRNDVGRPIWYCQQAQDTQAGPFADEATVARGSTTPEPVMTDGGER